jgi:hypothetical protein
MALTTVRPQGMGFNTGRRNLIINGAMQVSQRGTSFTDLANGNYGLDRFHISKITGGAVDIKQTDDAPTASQAGYLLTKCLHADVTTADSSVAADDMYTIRQSIEYKNIAHVGFGQSGTRYVTASFWVKSTKTGTFCCYIKTNAHNRAYTKEYTVSASDTWEYKKLTFPVDTSNSSDWNHNDSGGVLGWTLYSGTNYHITADTWTTTSSNFAPCTSNQVNALDSASNDFKITGIQLEVGTNASDFEHRSFGEELALCQRYYQEIGSGSYSALANGGYNSGTQYRWVHHNVVEMRSAPSLVQTTGSAYYRIETTGDLVSSWTAEAGNGKSQLIYNSSLSGATAGVYSSLKTNNSNALLALEAEL